MLKISSKDLPAVQKLVAEAKLRKNNSSNRESYQSFVEAVKCDPKYQELKNPIFWDVWSLINS
jgi:hypothetical protein